MGVDYPVNKGDIIRANRLNEVWHRRGDSEVILHPKFQLLPGKIGVRGEI